MGASQSSSVVSNSRPLPVVERSESRRTRKNSPGPDDLDEKFRAASLDDNQLPAQPMGRVFSETGRVSRAKTEDYVRQLLKDPKNRLGLSALSSNNPTKVC